MKKKADITIETTKNDAMCTWDRYRGKSPKDALTAIYGDAHMVSKAKRRWYWTSIAAKRWTSLTVRVLAFSLLLAGTALPLLAGLSDTAATRLYFTQLAVTLLAAAGVVQFADKVFGWSSGWMRYIQTATAMEAATTNFDLDWAKYLIAKDGDPTPADAQALFGLAEKLERELIKLQTDETNNWVTDFNAGATLLDAAIKAQREQTQVQLDALKTTVASAQAAAEKAAKPGSVIVVLTFKAEPKPVRIAVDGGPPQEFLGLEWTQSMPPGIHVLDVVPVEDPKLRRNTSVEVKPGAIDRYTMNFPV